MPERHCDLESFPAKKIQFDSNFCKAALRKFGGLLFLCSPGSVCGIRLKFENGHDASYDILVSDEGESFELMKHVELGEMTDPDVTIHFEPRKARFVKLQGVQKNDEYGYSIYEASVIVQQ